MNEEVLKTLNEAVECLTDAKTMYENNRNKATVSRAYYAMYHTAKAALVYANIETYTHQGVSVQFSKYFIKTGIFDKSLIKSYNKMLDARQKSDYEIGFSASQDDAKHAVEEAANFYSIVENYIISQNK